MKEVVLKFYNNQPITDQELVDFLVWFLENVEKKAFHSQEVIQIAQLVKQGIFQIHEAMERSTSILGLQLYKVFNKQGQLISIRLEDIPETITSKN